jgi:hypothetical protein
MENEKNVIITTSMTAPIELTITLKNIDNKKAEKIVEELKKGEKI